MEHFLLLFGAGLLAGAMNAAAGGGSFITLPALVFAGVPPVPANASSTVALFPGSLASAWVYREDLGAFEGVSMRAMLLASLSGGLSGALLLLVTPRTAFDVILPWLLLMGTLAFAFGRRVGAVLRRRFHIGPRTLLCGQFLLGTYGGYFGGAVGIMMMAVWSLVGLSDIKAMNAARTLLVGATNSIAVLCFVAANAVWWPQTCVMLAASVVGGHAGARVTRRLPSHLLRAGITIFNVAMTAAFFFRAAHVL
ncbi:sulfite exporter TauE/SafE family protein [Archangium violaceum]|uniref:sulfite exporter TauE/SafE family protein n=1 Tax=Archangium violaceum TaxID=83451 RepID=UPI001951DE3C|nr:sulfite exporter TauE/SafE family protein [Archangium violaceum]QRN95501.1 sulfite exporter TauE/SafE family protein [Archangium violaceum]